MSGTMYRRATPDLMSLLAGDGGGGSPAQDGGGDASPGGVDRASLIAKLLAPTDIGPPPESNKPSFGRRLAAALGDAANTYARSQLPQLQPSNYRNEQRALTEKGKEDMTRYERAKALAASESSREGARFLLNEADKSQANKDAVAAHKEFLDMQNKAKQEDRAQQLADKAAARAQEQDQFDKQKQWEEKKIHLQGEQDKAVAWIHSNAKDGDESAKFDQKTLPEIMSNIGGLADVARIALSGGDPNSKIPGMTPEQMQARVRRMIQASGMSQAGKTAAGAFAAKELMPEIDGFNQEQAAKAQQGTTVPLPQPGSPLEMSLGGMVQRAIPSLAK